jgi:hypothetical protein
MPNTQETDTPRPSAPTTQVSSNGYYFELHWTLGDLPYLPSSVTAAEAVGSDPETGNTERTRLGVRCSGFNPGVWAVMFWQRNRWETMAIPLTPTSYTEDDFCFRSREEAEQFVKLLVDTSGWQPGCNASVLAWIDRAELTGKLRECHQQIVAARTPAQERD